MSLLTAEEFERRRFELAEGGRWCELHEGRVVEYEPPAEMHGNSVLNLSKRVAGFRHHSDWMGACCFELGILTARDPDSVFVPAVSFFPRVGPFALSDEFFTELIPQVVIEIVSTPGRQRSMEQKVSRYFDHGVEIVWMLDDVSSGAKELTRPDDSIVAKRKQTLATPALPGLELHVPELFKAPEWWA